MRGIGLIEVMVSVLILAVGLLGVAAMQAVALRGGQSSLESTQAVIQTNAILEAMRVNRATANAFNTGAMRCTEAAGGHAIVEAWLEDLKTSIGTEDDETTCGQIAGCPDACVITVRWDDSRAGGAGQREIVTATQL
ncbi:type IV pilus modification protein PilV [uncultured Luteimonas sp.]|uniref:type IV pilus modification PilV family protein n=1 Tax=uncultured Luteimonas sp. TaxID=453144 RepID=UPI00261F70E9|nr:type IV pilus modification protein PilV [uncultured Luteimonas sp.]